MIGQVSGGIIAPGESHWIGAPTWAWRGDGSVPTHIYCHGAGGSMLQTLKSRDFINHRMLGKEYISMFGDMAGPQTWGNDASIARVHEYVLHARNTMGSSAKVYLSGASMGMITACNYARAYPQNVAAIAGMIPCTDIQMVLDNIGGSATAEVDAAYPPDGWDDATVGQTRSPIHMVENGLLPEDLPIHIWSAPDDPLTTPEMHAEFVAARPQTGLTTLAYGYGHTDWAIEACRAGVQEFFRSVREGEVA